MSNARELAELGGSYGTGGFVGMKNRIINGAMMIDQRNAGASVTGNNAVYPVDRYVIEATQTGKLTTGQNLNSVTPPVGFKKYVGFQSSSAYSVGSGDYFTFRQVIEGYNWNDMAYGTADAKTSTLSFWVYSSLTGTFGGSLRGYDGGSVVRSYPFTYTISSANTWTYITIVIPGDTTSSTAWTSTSATTNGWGFSVNFGLGVGSTSSGAAGSWSTNNYLSATGATSVVGTNGATFYITGVQLEKGSTATSFDYRPYGTELALCQRYYQTFTINMDSYASGASVFNFLNVPWQTAMRATPTIVYGAATGGSANYSAIGAGYSNAFTNNTQLTSTAAGRFYYLCQNTSSTASAEL